MWSFYGNIYKKWRCLLMGERKLIIGAHEMTEVIYIGVNVHAAGGNKKKGKC